MNHAADALNRNGIRMERRPLSGNERLFHQYWDDHLVDWPMCGAGRLTFMRGALQDLWLYIAYLDHHMAGMLVNEEGGGNALLLLHVRSAYRNRGIGRALVLEAGLHVGVHAPWNLGQGRGYWWQGVPEGKGEAFFIKQGFLKTWTSIDMLLDLTSWNRADFEVCHPVRPASDVDRAALLQMLEQEEDLSAWGPFYQALMEQGGAERIFVATRGEDIIGCAMLLEPHEIRWHERFDMEDGCPAKTGMTGETGGIGCLGVRGAFRETGVGSAMVVALTDELKRRGYARAFLGYTWLEAWYGKFGYRTCCRYMMGARGT